MAINYTDKFAKKVDERFYNEALSTPAVNNDYEFVGAKTVKVMSVNTVALNDYTLSGTSRYGTPKDLENEVQELTVEKDRAFTFVIDRKSIDDNDGQMAVGEALARQIRERVIPEVDLYRYGKIVAGAETDHVATGAITKTNAYSSVLEGQMALHNSKAPRVGRVLYVSSEFFKVIKQDDSFIKASDLGQQILLNGQVGTIDGLPVIVLAKSEIPENVAFFIAHPSATVAPVKLETYKVHEDAPGISGFLVEGRIRYDAFVLNNKKGAIYVHKTA